jgi:hypothetical protein
MNGCACLAGIPFARKQYLKFYEIAGQKNGRRAAKLCSMKDTANRLKNIFKLLQYISKYLTAKK